LANNLPVLKSTYDLYLADREWKAAQGFLPAPISMQEIKKRRIVIASVLKPVDDTRMSQKIGRSLTARSNVHVIGFPAPYASTIGGITFHTIHAYPFKRLSMKRLTAPFSFLSKALKLRGNDLIVCTHELLLAAVILKLITGCRIFYDVQENYFRNILYTDAFPWILRFPLALYVRFKEWILSPFVNHFLLAEESYQHEFSFPGKKFTVLENKFEGNVTTNQQKKSKKDGKTHLLFSGTLSELTGVYTAIDVATKLNALNPSVSLTIIGYASRSEEHRRIKRTIHDKTFIRLIGGDAMVSHADIVREIQTSDFGIIAYPPNKANSRLMPTKLYEYLANQLPILLSDNPTWVKKCSPYPAAVPFSPSHFNPGSLLVAIRTTEFYQTVPQNVTWSSEEPHLLQLF
jgi:glycosyltransferase involved in cell wall biosynthesis